MSFKDKNGYSLINPEQKVRISLSARAIITISEDMKIFSVPKISTFINTVFWHYYPTAKSSVSLYLQQRKLELERLFATTKIDDTAKELVINRLLETEKQEILDTIKQYNKTKASSKLYHINDDNVAYLVEDCDEDIFYTRPGQYIRSVIEEYCSLPFIKREEIYRKDVYDQIITACKEHKLLKIPANYYGKKQDFIVYPYKIVPDTFHTQSYLVCYSYKDGEESEKNKIIASFSMARVNPSTTYSRTFHLNKSEIAAIENYLEENSPAYLVGTPEKIQVKLTEKGKLSYQSRLYSRPEKADLLSSNENIDTIYTFDCTPQQAFNYFFSFGSDAEIIYPEHLRNRFKNTYKKAFDVYSDKSD